MVIMDKSKTIVPLRLMMLCGRFHVCRMNAIKAQFIFISPKWREGCLKCALIFHRDVKPLINY